MKIRSLAAISFVNLLLVLAGAHAESLDAPPAGAFTIVVIPDTQLYDGNKHAPAATTNPVFDNHTRWIVGNLRPEYPFLSRTSATSWISTTTPNGGWRRGAACTGLFSLTA